MMQVNEASALNRRAFLLGAGGVCAGMVVVGLAGCGSDAGNTGSGTSGSGTKAYTGKVAVSHLESVVASAPLYMAAQLGYYKDAGLDLTYVSFEGGEATVRGIISSTTPFGSPATLPALIAYGKGATKLRIIGNSYNAASVVFLAPKDLPVNSINDLAGKKIAIAQPDSITQYFAKLAVSKTDAKNVSIVNVGAPGAAWTAASQGVTDLAWSAPPLATQLVASGKAKVVFRASDLVPNWTDGVFATTQDVIASHPDVLRRFLAAVQKGMDLVVSDPDKAAQVYARAAQLDVATAKAAIMEQPKAWTTALSTQGLQANITAGKALGGLSGNVDLSTLVNNSFLPKGAPPA